MSVHSTPGAADSAANSSGFAVMVSSMSKARFMVASFDAGPSQVVIPNILQLR